MLARHAQSAWQLDRGDDWDSPLTELGHAQARRLAAWLATGPGRAVAAVRASPLQRARQTAAYAGRALGLEVITDDELREAPFHVAEELPQRPAPLAPAAPFAPSARYRAFRAQVGRALGRLVEAAAAPGSGPVLAITHGGWIKTALRVAAGSDALCARLYNACLTELEWRRGRWHLVHLNLWDHLSVDLRSE